ncbi:response regulator transcription factor [Dictyobacter kobayashii]|uniref:DNA-binding response regulator n=1 Tax=Dictyobacter kobayashii TaxID=2014872 RepID=A0A402AUX0_9CHLR|nr:response regulator transcription factor [Dictyobacter kobayashii]GCE22921.1 DNA-binding response regulator [Dictyobacter kobayashii]
MNIQQIRVLIVDDQRLMREGLRIILEDADDIEVIGEAENGMLAIQLAQEKEPDVIMDIRMPVCDGIEATERIRKQASSSRPRILLLTTFDTPEMVIEGMRAGAAGYLLKDCSAEEVSGAIRTVARGQILLQAASAAQLLAGLAAPVAPPPPTPAAQLESSGLTARELDVVKLIVKGHNNTEIASALSVSDSTIKTHINHIFAKLGARDRAQLVVLAHQLGIA